MLANMLKPMILYQIPYCMTYTFRMCDLVAQGTNRHKKTPSVRKRDISIDATH